MIYFVTKRIHNVKADEEFIITENLEFVISKLKKIENKQFGFDLETTGLDPFLADDLLIILGNEGLQFVIDSESYTKDEIRNIFISIGLDSLFVGQNLKFDYKFIKTKYNLELRNLYDLMIIEQRLLQNSGLSNRLDDIIKRRLKVLPIEMNKEVRLEFVDKNKKSFIFENHHIIYAAGDIKYLFKVKEIQENLIIKANQNFLIYNIELPLIPILANAELEGFTLDVEKWKEIIEFNKDKKFEYQCKLDEELKLLRSNLADNKNLPYLTGGKFDRVRYKKNNINQFDLFDSFKEIEAVDNNLAFVNYGSTDQLINIFARLKQPVPTKKGNYVVPEFKKNQKGKEVIDKSMNDFTTGESVIEGYLIENPNSPIKVFIKHLIEFREATTRLNTFGFKFIKKFLNPKTNKVHTIFRQCNTTTGRLQSGDKNNGWFNSQNIPAEKKYRECFRTDKDYLIATTDLSGAEAVIMIDKAHDEEFYKMAIVNDDAHSPLAQAVWRTIGEYRYNELINNSIDSNIKLEEANKLKNIIISKKENKDLRTAFKPMTFGSIYGMHDKKTAKTLNISVAEAKIALQVIKKMIPKTFKMVETNAKFAVSNGYLVLNGRTNSRIWYPKVIEANKWKTNLDFMDLVEIEGSARNVAIQGTQADMLKEMMVELYKGIIKQNIDACLLGQVHDELLYKFHKKHLEPTIIFTDDNGVDTLVNFPNFKKLTMCKIANRYLSYIKMGAEQYVGETWTK